MLKAILFDCDGVLVDSEPVHFVMFQKVLAEEGIELTLEDYETRYLAMDDRGCFRAVYRDADKEMGEDLLDDLVARKSTYFAKEMSGEPPTFDGVVEFVRNAAAKYPMMIASGALGHEVKHAVVGLKISDCFKGIVAAEDVVNGKPNPEAYLTAQARLSKAEFGGALKAEECLVIEDSFHGIRAAKSAGMWCLAVTNSYPASELSEADWVSESLRAFDLGAAEQAMQS
ncbi:MAG: HAD family phosphatase [Planctomycetota bacterium]|nr:HAD family phosphatase [Planctomycetota bacterium]